MGLDHPILRGGLQALTYCTKHEGGMVLFTSFDNGQWPMVSCLDHLVPFAIFGGLKKRLFFHLTNPTGRIRFFFGHQNLYSQTLEIYWLESCFATSLPPKKVWGPTKNIHQRLQLHEPRLVELLSAAVRSGAQVFFFFVCGDRASGVDCVHNTLYDGIVLQLWFIILTLHIFSTGLPCCFYCYWHIYTYILHDSLFTLRI